MNLEDIEIKYINGIKSVYLKNKIRKMKLNQDNVEIMENLGKLEHWVINGPSGFMSAMHFNGLKSEYKKDYRELVKELNPKRHKRSLKEDKKAEIETIKESARSKNINKSKLAHIRRVWRR